MHNIYRLYGNLASACERLCNLKECLRSFENQLNLAKDLCNKELIFNSLNSIGLVYNRLNNYEKAVEFFESSLKIMDQISNQMDALNLVKLKIKQNNLLGELHFKLGDLKSASLNFIAQLNLTDELINNKLKWLIQKTEMDQIFVQKCMTMLNLAMIFTKLNNFKANIEQYEKCLNSLKQNNLLLNDAKLAQQIIELHGRVFIGLINNYLYLKDTLRASLYAHAMLDFTIKETNRIKEEKSKLQEEQVDLSEEEQNILTRRQWYLKFLEISACSKLATCFAKQNRLLDAYKLHLREAELANQLKNTLLITRAYSHIAQIYFKSRKYEKCIFLYKQILLMIETSLLIQNKKETENEAEKDLSEYVDQNCLLNDNTAYNSTELVMNDERIIQMIYFTVSNIGLCMELLGKVDDASLMFHEQCEISKLLQNPKFKTNALLNLVNLYLNKLKLVDEHNEQQYSNIRQSDTVSIEIELTIVLNKLIELYKSTNDSNGLLFATQCLAYIYQKNGHVKKAIDIYLMNIELCRFIGQFDCLIKSLFNLSLCFKMVRNYKESYKYQLEYFNLINKIDKNELDRFVSLGILADLSLEICNSNANYQRCVQIQIDRMKIIKSLTTTVNEQVFDEKNNTS